MFSSAELRHLSYENCPAGADQQIRSAAERWVSRYSGETIGATTLHAQNEFAYGALTTGDFVYLGQQPFDLLQPALNGRLSAADILYADLGHRLIERLFALQQILLNLGEIRFFATQIYQNYATNIWMIGVVR